jgi:hypothetical protein
MEAIELEKKDALGLAAKTLKDLKETNAKLAQTSRELAAKAAEEQVKVKEFNCTWLGKSSRLTTGVARRRLLQPKRQCLGASSRGRGRAP